MKKRILITIFGIIIIVIGYYGFVIFDYSQAIKKDIHKNIEYYKTAKNLKIQNLKKLDTVNGDDYNVLFFNPSEVEFDKLIKVHGENSGLYEVDADFAFYANKVYDSISKTDLKIKIVTERIIKLTFITGEKYFDRIENKKGQFGVIFNKSNCEPIINFGVMTDVGMFQELEEYNKNCK